MPSSKPGDRQTILPFETAPMVEDDLDQVLAIERASYPTPWSSESFLYDLHQNSCARNYVLRREGRVAAFICVWIVDVHLQINNLAVDPLHRRMGYGSALLSNVLALARSEGCSTAALEVRPSNRPARELYSRFGFREVGRRKGYYQDTQEDAILMNLELDQEAAPGADTVESKPRIL